MREESQTNPELKELLASGKLAPEEQTAQFLLKKMNSIYREYYEHIVLKESEQAVTTDNQTTDEPVTIETNQNSSPSFIMEGYPRNTTQAKQFLTWFTGGDIHFSKNNTVILHLLVDKECIKERLRGRLIHDKSGRTYHTEFRKPKEDTKDDITGEPLTKRDDDLNDEAIVNRMETYKSQTLPTLEMLIDNEFDVVDVIAIEQDIEKVRSKVMKTLMEKGFIAKPSVAAAVPPKQATTTTSTAAPQTNTSASTTSQANTTPAAATTPGASTSTAEPSAGSTSSA